MKHLITISTILFVLFISCNSARTQDNQQQEMPKALENESSYDLSSKRSYGDLLENLYNEHVDNTPELKELETNIVHLSKIKNDSLEPFNKYDQKNLTYYNSADMQVGQIKDSVLKEKMKSLIASSLAKYKSTISQDTALIKSINNKNLELNDIHAVIKITQTLPLIQKYQQENLPATKALKEILKQFNETITHMGTLSKK